LLVNHSGAALEHHAAGTTAPAGPVEAARPAQAGALAEVRALGAALGECAAAADLAVLAAQRRKVAAAAARPASGRAGSGGAWRAGHSRSPSLDAHRLQLSPRSMDGATPRRAADPADRVSPGAGGRAPSRMAALRGLSPAPPAVGDAGAACDPLASMRLGPSAGPAAEQGSVSGGSARGADQEYGGLKTLETASEAELVLHALLAVAPLAAPDPAAGPGASAAPPLAALLAAQLVACAEGQVRAPQDL